MSKSRTKQELLQIISKADILDFDLHVINRKDSASAKKTIENTFVSQARSAIGSQRDIILVAIKVR